MEFSTTSESSVRFRQNSLHCSLAVAAIFSVLFVLIFATVADARPEADRDHERAWSEFTARHREATVFWGRIRGNPYATYGFEPIDNRYGGEEDDGLGGK